MYGLKSEIMASNIGLKRVVGTREGKEDLWDKKNEKRAQKKYKKYNFEPNMGVFWGDKVMGGIEIILSPKWAIIVLI